jgi:hypothetical protein
VWIVPKRGKNMIMCLENLFFFVSTVAKSRLDLDENAAGFDHSD